VISSIHAYDYLRLIYFLSTSVYSTLGVSAIMRYINRRFNYLLTYLLHRLTYNDQIRRGNFYVGWRVFRMSAMPLHLAQMRRAVSQR